MLRAKSLLVWLSLVVICWISLKNSVAKLPPSQRAYLRVTESNSIESYLPETSSSNIHAPNDLVGRKLVDNHTDTGEHDEAVTEHASGHPTLFKALSAIHIEMGTYAMFIIIGFIILLKQMTEALYAFTQDTPFYEMVGKIEEELMIVGTSSFILKVVVNTTDFATNEWAYPIEFAEILVPLIAFSYCAIGVLVILISLKQCYAWSRANNLKSLEILDDYFEASKRMYFK